jgi:hypothetical protein
MVDNGHAQSSAIQQQNGRFQARYGAILEPNRRIDDQRTVVNAMRKQS